MGTIKSTISEYKQMKYMKMMSEPINDPYYRLAYYYDMIGYGLSLLNEKKIPEHWQDRK